MYLSHSELVIEKYLINIWRNEEMKTQYRITFALCVMVFVTAGMAIGAADSNNSTDANTTDGNGTNATVTAVDTGTPEGPAVTTVEPAETTVEPAVTTVVSESPDETTTEPIEPVNDNEDEEAETPSSTPEQSPGFGVVGAIMVVISAVYLIKKVR